MDKRTLNERDICTKFITLPPRDLHGRTVWVTRSRPKVDRIACQYFQPLDPNCLLVSELQALMGADCPVALQRKDNDCAQAHRRLFPFHRRCRRGARPLAIRLLRRRTRRRLDSGDRGHRYRDPRAQSGLLDELTLITHPFIAGAGRRLFEPTDPTSRLELKATLRTSKGNVVVTYGLRGT